MTAPTTSVGQPTRTLPYRQLVDDELWGRLTGRIVKEEQLSSEEAEAIIDGALGFLKLCADHPDQRFAPSQKVDIGWHTIMMYTRGYAELCQRIAGRFLHHEPNDVPGLQMEAGGSHETVAFMMQHGIAFDPTVWNLSGTCTVDCDNGSGPPRNCTCC